LRSDPIVKSYVDVLPPELLTALTAECDLIANYERSRPPLASGKYRTHWLPRGRRPRFAIEEAVRFLRKLVRPDDAANVGAEWWVQKVDANNTRTTPIGWHVDKDEAVATLKHYLLHPALGSIFYLTDAGGPTAVTDQWSPHGNGYVPEAPREGALSFPRRNKYTLFHGELLHGVLAGDAAAPPATRLTFLVNWWDVKPLAPNCEELDPAAVPNLRVWSRAELASFRAALTHPLVPGRRVGLADLYNYNTAAADSGDTAAHALVPTDYDLSGRPGPGTLSGADVYTYKFRYGGDSHTEY
jgi:hypothetical protein